MSDIAIKFENISKQYRLGLIGTGTILHDINRWWYTARGKEDPYLKIGEVNDRSSKGNSKYVWALKDITFDVKQGEVVGIIGKNGAGKSTLLKILSRVTSPTTGSIKAKGRIASLLEVGTGFHPELTGRENIFMNGSIMGMSKAEIKSKMDEIVDFAGIERYIDTPVKRYSSGMTVRLGFAIAAHLEPDILVVDEVLAVGDAEFQKKAIGKMKDVSTSEGRTVLFVSHNMAAVRNLCNSGIVLANGAIAFNGNCEDALDFYNNEQQLIAKIPLLDRRDRKGNGMVRATNIYFTDENCREIETLITGRSAYIVCELENNIPESEEWPFRFDINIRDSKDVYVTQLTTFYQEKINSITSKVKEIKIFIPRLNLLQDSYRLSIYCKVGNEETDWIENAAELIVDEGDYFRVGRNMPKGFGIIAMNHSIDLINHDCC